MNVLKVFLFGALLTGCTVMVNGKPRRIGGGSDPAPAVAPAAQPSGTSQAAAPAAARPAARPLAVVPGRVIAVEPTLGRDPLVVTFDSAFDTTWSKVFGRGSNSPDCGNSIPSQPIGSFLLAQHDKDLEVNVIGGGNDGFVVRRGDLYWTSCTYSTGNVPTMAASKDGWEPGRYDIYPVARYGHGGKPMRFTVELSRPTAPVSWDAAQRLVISARLDKPMFVEVATRPGRRVLREARAGYNCGKIALPATPDIALTIERPIPGLTIRPLPTAVPVTIRREFERDGKQTRGCVKGGSSGSNRDAPSYRAPSEVSFNRDDEGLYGISFGTPDPDQETKITLMIFDDSTKFDALAVRPFGGETPALEQRWVGYQLPQLRTDRLGYSERYDDAALAARVFAAVPEQALVYSKLDLDKDIASGSSDSFPIKNEPLALIGLERERATVLTADGLRFSVKKTHILLAPDGQIAFPAAPRELRSMTLGKTIALLPPAAKKLGDAHYKRVKAREACRDRAWAPYGRQLPSISRPAGSRVIIYKSARTKQIERAGDRAMDRKCGSHQQFEKQNEATRKKLLVHVAKGRAKLYAQATEHLRR